MSPNPSIPINTFSKADAAQLIEVARQKGWELPHQGQSASGHPLPILQKASSSDDAPVVLLTTGIHGDEPAGPLAVLHCLQNDLFDPRCHWLLSPLGNPDGLAKASRFNADGIDINRDFKHTHTVEARFLKNAYRQLPMPYLHLSLHEDWEYPQGYLYEINTGTLPSLADPLLDGIEREVGLSDAELLDGHTPTRRGFICHESTPDEPDGWPEAIWLVRTFPLLSYTLETPSGQPLKQRIACHCAFIKQAAEELLKVCSRVTNNENGMV
jgi:murein peptide amidase A